MKNLKVICLFVTTTCIAWTMGYNFGSKHLSVTAFKTKKEYRLAITTTNNTKQTPLNAQFVSKGYWITEHWIRNDEREVIQFSQYFHGVPNR